MDSPFGTGGIFTSNPGAPSGFGGGQNKLGGPAPGFTSPFDQQAVGRALNLNETALSNRYAQLGLSATGATPPGAGKGKIMAHAGPGGAPGGPAGGVGVGGGANFAGGQASMPTGEQMDLGMIPTLTGGLPGEAQATLGEIQNAELASSGGGGGGGGGKGGGGGGKGGLGGMMGPMMMMGK